MKDIEIDFAKDLVSRFGEDRFYHAMIRWGFSHELVLTHIALGGTEQEWTRKCDELRLGSVEGIASFPPGHDFLEGEAWEVMCRTAYALSLHFKEYAIKRKALPSSIHARMLMGSQNKWTKKYIEWLGAE